MILLTGDTHGDANRFYEIKELCRRLSTEPKDVLIILGDVGLNYSGGNRDYAVKKILASISITTLCIHGNHENRPQNIASYKMKEWREGTIFYEEEFPNLLFAKDGEIYNLEGQKAIAIGGAYSVDKEYRLKRNWGWWEDEQPNKETKEYVEIQLEKVDWKIDIVLSHTGPLKYEPVELFLNFIDQSKVDKSTEIWLDLIESKLNYKHWYFGHYHANKKVNESVTILFEEIQMIKKH